MLPSSLRERVPAIPTEVEQVVLRALAKDPKARFASVADFAQPWSRPATSVLLLNRDTLPANNLLLGPLQRQDMRRCWLSQISIIPNGDLPHLPISWWEQLNQPCIQTPLHHTDSIHPRAELTSETPQSGSDDCTHSCCCVTSSWNRPCQSSRKTGVSREAVQRC